jgi:hypothetical protein
MNFYSGSPLLHEQFCHSINNKPSDCRSPDTVAQNNNSMWNVWFGYNVNSGVSEQQWTGKDATDRS